MTSTPSLPAQIEPREPGWYWVRVFEGGPWHPYHWYHSRDGEAFWIGRSVDDEPMAEIGPRIPDPVTLQQHERLEAGAVEPVITPEMLRAGISVAEAHFLQAHGAWRDLVVAVYRAMYLSRPSPSGETEVTLSRKEVAENSGGRR